MEATLSGKVFFRATSKEWFLSFVYLFSLSLVGLNFWPAILITLLILFNRFVKNKSEFIVQLFILCTYSGFLSDDQLPVKLSDILMGVSVLVLFTHRFDEHIRVINKIILIYAIGVVGISLLSNEPMSIQIRMMRYYFCIIVYLLPLVLLAKQSDSFLEVGRYLTVYSLLICVFYIIDGFILSGFIFLPNTPYDNGYPSTWYNPIWEPFSDWFPRKYPEGLFILIPTAYYLSRYFKLSFLGWLIILGALVASRTLTFTAGAVVVYIFSLPNRRLIMNITKGVVIGSVLLYVVDANTGKYLRVASTVDQFFELRDAIETNDLKKLSEFASGRMAQLLPKIDKLVGDGKLMTGFGFIHPQKSTNVELFLKNDYYSDISASTSIETPAAVEVTQVQTILNIGVIGLIFQIAVYVFMAIFVSRHFKEWKLFAAVLIGVNVAGLGGFIGLNSPFNMWLALSLGLTLVGGRREFAEPQPEPLTDSAD